MVIIFIVQLYKKVVNAWRFKWSAKTNLTIFKKNIYSFNSKETPDFGSNSLKRSVNIST